LVLIVVFCHWVLLLQKAIETDRKPFPKRLVDLAQLAYRTDVNASVASQIAEGQKLRGSDADATESPQTQEAHSTRREPNVAVLKFHTDIASAPLTIRIRLHTEWSESSVIYMSHAAEAGCGGQLYRSETFLVQGRLLCRDQMPMVAKGSCPEGVSPDPHRRCPSHDPLCGCHGPIMTRGMVGWAGGSTGPDFFVYIGDGPALHWAHDHTVFGQLADEESWDAVRALRKLPVRTGGMTMLTKPVDFEVGPRGEHREGATA